MGVHSCWYDSASQQLVKSFFESDEYFTVSYSQSDETDPITADDGKGIIDATPYNLYDSIN